MTPFALSASLRIGVVGPNLVAARLAMVFRDYGQHRVIGYGLQTQMLTGPDAVRWTEQDVVNCPNPQALVRLSDLVFVTDPSWCVTITRASDVERAHPPLVVATATRRLHLRLLALRLHGRNPFGYSPVEETATMDELASPDQIWVASQSEQVHTLVERSWAPVVNTVPVIHTGFSRVSETGLLLPPSVSERLRGIEAPPAQPTTPE